MLRGVAVLGAAFFLPVDGLRRSVLLRLVRGMKALFARTRRAPSLRRLAGLEQPPEATRAQARHAQEDRLRSRLQVQLRPRPEEREADAEQAIEMRVAVREEA